MPSSSNKSLSRTPFYFTSRYRSRHLPATAPIRSFSQEHEAHQVEDLNAHDLLPAELRQLKQDLAFYNNIGRLVTFNRVIKDWVTWDRCVYILNPYYIPSCLYLPPIGHVVLSKPDLEPSPPSQLVDFTMFPTSLPLCALMPSIIGAP